MKLQDFLSAILAKTPYQVIDKGDFNMIERGRWRPIWEIKKYKGIKENPYLILPENLYDVIMFENNSLLNEGINEMWKRIAGLGGTAYSEGNAYLGVGDSSTSVSASQEGLQGSNKSFRPMDATYPQISNQTITFRSTFGANDANFNWREYTVVNAASDTGKNICRRAEDHGVKTNPDIWVLSLSITLS